MEGKRDLELVPPNPLQILGVLSPWQVKCATCGSTNTDTRKRKSIVCQFQPKLGNGLALFKTGSQTLLFTKGEENEETV